MDVSAVHDGATALPSSIRRAIAFMEEHLSEPISVADIADPADVTVGEIARAWGFAHGPRFAAAYLAQYEQRPSQTLRR